MCVCVCVCVKGSEVILPFLLSPAAPVCVLIILVPMAAEGDTKLGGVAGLEAEVRRLRERVAQLEQELSAAHMTKGGGVRRERITQMSAEVVDSNPYRYPPHPDLARCILSITRPALPLSLPPSLPPSLPLPAVG